MKIVTALLGIAFLILVTVSIFFMYENAGMHVDWCHYMRNNCSKETTSI